MKRLFWLGLLFLPACGGSGGGNGESSTGSPAPVAANSSLGTNLSSIEYYSSELVFVDVFKHAAEWIAQDIAYGGPWDTGQPFAGTTADGYPLLNPGQAAATLLCRAIQGHYPAGQYVCLYEGQGTITFGFDAAVASQTPGKIVINVTPGNGGIFLRITATNPADPIRNIRVLMPGHEFTYQTQPFTPEFLERWKKFRVFRFMDWQKTNNSQLQHWAQRPTTTWYTQAGRNGVAVEYMVRLANAAGADPWFNMPHLATDDFVRKFAEMVRDTLNPGRKIYIEYSNEVWNSIFLQTYYAQDRGLALGLSTIPFEALLRYYSRRSVEIFEIWKDVVGADRLVRVLASQAVNPWLGQTIMDWQQAYLKADAFAIAPYFGAALGAADTQNTVAQMSVAQVLASCDSDIDVMMGYVAQQVASASARGLKLIAYEGGQHLAGREGAENNDTLTALFLSTNRDPGIKAVYAKYLNAWKNAGGTLLVHFSSMGLYTKWGSWGALEWHDQTTAPKYEALLEFIEGTPAWWP